jgi:hypothetical protein
VKPSQSSTPIDIGEHPKDFDEEDTCLLEQAVEKLVRVGQQVGVTPEEIGKSITNKCIPSE